MSVFQMNPKWHGISHSGRCILEIERGDTQTGSSERADAPLHITLFQCVPKGNKMDLIVRQAVEAGVETVVPVQSENSIPRLNDDNFDKKRQRWLRIARQAMQQCGRRNVPVITPPVAVSEVSKLWNENAGPADICLFFHEKSLGHGGLHDLLSGGPQAVGICVGPEGGFSPGEVTGLLKSGLQPVYINTNVLRSETAALYAVAAVQTIILERTSWNLRQ